MIELTCPLGHTCEVRDKSGATVLRRCRMYRYIDMLDPQTGENIQQWDCCIPQTMTMQKEIGRLTCNLSVDIQTFRNEMVKGNDRFMGMISTAQNKRLNGGDS